MNTCDLENNYSPLITNNTKVQALESTLQKSLICFKELILDFQHLQVESENYKSQLLTQRELCERNNCSSAESLKNVIESKNKILQSIESILTQLNETKNFSLVDEALRIVFGYSSPKKDVIVKKTMTHPISEEQSSKTEEVSLKDDSLNVIEGTPTGRTSPIIHTKKLRNSNVGKSTEIRDKLKCPDNWVTPEKKTIKLTYPVPNNSKPGSRYRQARLNLVKVKQTSLVDLTCSPEFAGGARSSRSDNHDVKPLIKKESLADDDTILPSPTSVPLNFTFKTSTKNSPKKVPNVPISLKIKKEIVNKPDLVENIENIPKTNVTMDDSMNILNHLLRRFKNEDKVIKIKTIDKEETDFENDSSMSLLQHENNLPAVLCSPKKRPLSENLNIINTPPKKEIEPTKIVATADNVKRRIAEVPEPMYREPAPRKKSEKKALPGWCCEECEYFFGDLYKGDPEAMAKRIAECSKHRGRHNPARPRTPPNFWNPRWTVPEDTEELNRMNNAI